MNNSPKSKKSEEVSRGTVSSSSLSKPQGGASVNKKLAPILNVIPAHRQASNAQTKSGSQNSIPKQGNSQPLLAATRLGKTNSVVTLKSRPVERGKQIVVQAGSPVKHSKSSKKKKSKVAKGIGMNPYLNVLLDPFNAPSAKIVDDQCHPSAVFKIIRRIQMISNADGIAGVCLGNYIPSAGRTTGSLIPLQNHIALPADQFDYILGQTTWGSSTEASLFVGQTAQADAIRLLQWENETDGVRNLFSHCRLVAAGISCHFNGTPLDAKGRIIAVSTPKSTYWEDRTISDPVTLDDLLELPGAINVPINQLKGALAVYKPVDYTSFDYVDLEDPIYQTVDISTGTDEVKVAYDRARPGVLCLVADGTTEGSSFTFTFTAHYEGIPRYSTLNLVELENSPSDPLELAHTMNVIQQTPNTLGNADAAINASRDGGDHSVSIPHASERPKQGTTLEKVISGIGSVGNVVSKVAPLAMELLAMI